MTARNGGRIGGNRPTQLVPGAPTGSIPPFVPDRIVRPAGKNFHVVNVCGTGIRTADQASSHGRPTGPGVIVPGLMPDGIIRAAREEVDQIITTANSRRIRRKIAALGTPPRPPSEVGIIILVPYRIVQSALEHVNATRGRRRINISSIIRKTDMHMGIVA